MTAATQEKACGFSNAETWTVNNILTNYKTHAEKANKIVDQIMRWDDDNDILIPRVMKTIRAYFTEVSDWNLATDYRMPGASREECSDIKHAIADLFNAALARVQWREVATHLIDMWRERRLDENGKYRVSDEG